MYLFLLAVRSLLRTLGLDILDGCPTPRFARSRGPARRRDKKHSSHSTRQPDLLRSQQYLEILEMPHPYFAADTGALASCLACSWAVSWKLVRIAADALADR